MLRKTAKTKHPKELRRQARAEAVDPELAAEIAKLRQYDEADLASSLECARDLYHRQPKWITEKFPEHLAQAYEAQQGRRPEGHIEFGEIDMLEPGYKQDLRRRAQETLDYQRRQERKSPVEQETAAGLADHALIKRFLADFERWNSYGPSSVYQDRITSDCADQASDELFEVALGLALRSGNKQKLQARLVAWIREEEAEAGKEAAA